MDEILSNTEVGQALGAGDHAGATAAGWRALRLAVVSMGLLGVGVIYYAYELAFFFIGDEPLTVKYTVQLVQILGGMMPLLAVEFAIGGALRGTSRRSAAAYGRKWSARRRCF